APVGDSTPSVDLNAHVDALVKEPESHAEFEPGNAGSEPGQTERVTAPPAESAFVIEHEETEEAEAAHQDDEPGQQEDLSVVGSEGHGAGPEERETGHA